MSRSWPEIDTHVTFDEAIDKVLAALEPLGPEYTATLAQRVCRDAGAIAMKPKGKRSGAFSSGSYGAPPYILMNYKSDVFVDVYTLAHEAGHSMHTWFAQKSQPSRITTTPSSSPKWPAPSTKNCSRIIFSTRPRQEDARLHHQPPDRRHPRHALPADDVRGVREAHPCDRGTRASRSRSTASTRDLPRLAEAYFGPAFALDPELDLECLRIPHFYSAFYVYKCAPAFSAAIALSRAGLCRARRVRWGC